MKRNELVNIIKKIGISILIFILGSYSAFAFESEYRRFIRYLYPIISNGQVVIKTPRKDFHFPSTQYCCAFGFFLVLTYFIYSIQKLNSWLRVLLLGLFTFLATLTLYIKIDTKMKIIECTNCNNGIYEIWHYDFPYDKLFILSLLVTLSIVFFFKIYVNKKNT